MFSIFKSKKKKIADAAVALRHYEIASESVELLRKTVYPKTFFGRCDDVAFEEERMTGRPSKFKKDTALQTKLQMEFLDRAIAAGKKDLLRKEMPKYVGRLTTEALAYYRGLGL